LTLVAAVLTVTRAAVIDRRGQQRGAGNAQPVGLTLFIIDCYGLLAGGI